MGVRPPQQGTDDEPETVAFGIAALDGYLEDSGLQFPATTDEVLETLGNREIPYDAAGNTVPLSAVLDASRHDSFETRQGFMNELHPIFEARRERAKTSVVARLRTLLPF
ncbi:MAG: hypothetical protein ACOCQ7_00690 [Natronomonas sp.]